MAAVPFWGGEKQARAGNKMRLVEIVVFGGFSLMLTDGHTDGRTHGRTDRPSYRDARTHLKILIPGR